MLTMAWQEAFREILLAFKEGCELDAALAAAVEMPDTNEDDYCANLRTSYVVHCTFSAMVVEALAVEPQQVVPD